jgi:hypothetical protein
MNLSRYYVRSESVKTVKMPLAILVALAVAALVMGCGCSNKVIAEADSPDGTLRATVFERDCGATTDFSRIVSITGKEEDYTRENSFVFVVEGEKDIQLKWTGRRQLSVECRACTNTVVFKQLIALRKVEIAYPASRLGG